MNDQTDLPGIPGKSKVPLQERIARLMEHLGMTQADLAEQTGFSPSVISQWFAGKYEHGDRVTQALEAWAAARAGDFLELRNAKLVFEACNFAVQERRIVLVVGRPGLGKTMALREFHRRTVRSSTELLYHHVSPLIKHGSLAKMLARRFELGETGTAYDMVESVLHKMRRHPVPMIFDEANALDLKCLETIRYIYDMVPIGVVLCGSIQLQRTLSDGGKRMLETEQLQSRIGLRVILETMKDKEVGEVVKRHFGDEVDREVVREFSDQSRGVIRDLVNGIAIVKALVKRNSLEGPTVDAVRSAYRVQLLHQGPGPRKPN